MHYPNKYKKILILLGGIERNPAGVTFITNQGFSVVLNLINCHEECFEAVKSSTKSLHGLFYAWHHLIIQLRYKIFNVNDKFEPKSVPEGGSNLEISNKTHPLSQRVSLLKSGILNKAFRWLMVQIFPHICRFSQ